MTSRERVYAAANHKEPDRVPICFGGTAASGMEECPPKYQYRAATRLYDYLNLKDAEPVKISPVGNIVGNIDEKCMIRLHSDMRSLSDSPPGAEIIDDEHKVWPFLYGMRIKKCGIYDMIDMKIRPKFYHQLCEKFMEINLAFADKFYGKVGKYLDAAMVFDDWQPDRYFDVTC